MICLSMVVDLYDGVIYSSGKVDHPVNLDNARLPWDCCCELDLYIDGVAARLAEELEPEMGTS
jgi:hypothetical protein